MPPMNAPAESLRAVSRIAPRFMLTSPVATQASLIGASRSLEEIDRLSGTKSHPQDLERVEARVAHHRRDRTAPPQVDDGPERTERAGRDRRVPSLYVMTETERRAQHDHPGGRAAKMPLESLQQERTLKLLANPAGHD